MDQPKSVSDLYLKALSFFAYGALLLCSYLLVDRYQAISSEIAKISNLSERLGKIEARLERSADR